MRRPSSSLKFSLAYTYESYFFQVFECVSSMELDTQPKTESFTGRMDTKKYHFDPGLHFMREKWAKIMEKSKKGKKNFFPAILA